MGRHHAQPTPRPWRRRTATAARHLALACDGLSLLTTSGSPTDLTARATSLALRALATTLDRVHG